jgi:DNA-binding NtrC family response regulator
MDKFGLCFTRVDSTAKAVASVRLSPEKYSLVLSDFKRENDKRSGYALLDDLKSTGKNYPVIFYALEFTQAQADDARRRGAPEVRSPFDLYDEVYAVLGNAQKPVGKLELIKQWIFGCRNSKN